MKTDSVTVLLLSLAMLATRAILRKDSMTSGDPDVFFWQVLKGKRLEATSQ
jgi:hypothetical protein